MKDKKIVKEKGILRIADIDSNQILSLLAKKHEKDVFVPECKNGQSWGVQDMYKLDAWVLQRTYSPLTTIGYEIKCSRADFENDQKWTHYLNLCHLFYFVCPAGLVRATDLPPEIGIIWATKDSLHTKHRPTRMTPDIDKMNKLLTYVVMARSNIVANMYAVGLQPAPLPHLEELRKVVERANEKKELAYFVKGHIAKAYQNLLEEKEKVAKKQAIVEHFERKLAQLGITWDSTINDWREDNRVGNEIDLVKGHVDYVTLRNMEDAAKILQVLVGTIKGYYNEAAKVAAEVKSNKES